MMPRKSASSMKAVPIALIAAPGVLPRRRQPEPPIAQPGEQERDDGPERAERQPGEQ